MSLKEAVLKKCLEILDSKIADLQNILHDLQQSAANETKSTAGDKHETALAMLQIEQENTGRQLQVLLQQRLQLIQINFKKKPNTIQAGTLVYTTTSLVFIAVGLGKILTEGKNCLVISNTSPLGSLLIGKQPGDTVQCNGINYIVTSIE